MSYAILAERLSLSEQGRLRGAAERQARLRLAKKLAIDPMAAVDDKNPAIIARDADYVVDFVPAATSVGLPGWRTMPLAVAGTLYSVFANNVPAALTPQVPNNQSWVFYGLDILGNDAAVHSVSFIQFGIGSAANRRAQFDLDGLYGGLAVSGYFSQPVVYDPQEIATVMVRCDVPTGVGGRIRLMTLIAEPIQQTVI